MRHGWSRWLLVVLAALLPTLLSLLVNLATGLELPEVASNPWAVWPALVALTVASVVVAVRLLVGSGRLPADPAPFVDRSDEVADLRRYFTGRGPDGPRVAVVSGPAGVGKSAHAIHCH